MKNLDAAMPIYEFECTKCGKRSSILTLRVGEQISERCGHCGGSLKRIMSRFAMPRSEDARMESLADPSNFSDLDEGDPRSVARLMRRMGKEMGDEFGGDDFEEAVDELERGGDLGTDDSSGSEGPDDEL
jgi:putative FmdB family regulatory protein